MPAGPFVARHPAAKPPADICHGRRRTDADARPSPHPRRADVAGDDPRRQAAEHDALPRGEAAAAMPVSRTLSRKLNKFSCCETTRFFSRKRTLIVF